MSTTRKKLLSASSLTKLVSKHTTRSKLAEKTSSTSRHNRKGNPEFDAHPDQHNMLADENVIVEIYTNITLITKKFNNDSGFKIVLKSHNFKYHKTFIKIKSTRFFTSIYSES